MRDLYIGGPRRAKKGGIMWKLYLFLFFFLIIVGAGLKVSSPLLVEKWLNKQGSGKQGYAYTVREVELALRDGEITLKDVKVFNPTTKVALLESPSLKLKINIQDILRAEERKMIISGDKLDVFLSQDLTSEIHRITNSSPRHDLYLSLLEGKFSLVSIIEKKPNESRTLVKLHDVNLKMKELSVASVNKKTEFSLVSKIANGGEMNLSGSINEEGQNSWKIEGSLKEFSPNLFNQLAGSHLPFSFNESAINAQIIAHSSDGELKGEIVPEVTKLNLISERPGLEKQVIARALTEELTFSLPFRLKDELTLEYADTYKKLKDYRKYPLSVSFIR